FFFRRPFPHRFLLAVPWHLPTHSGAPPPDSKDLDTRCPRLLPAHPEYLCDHSFASLHRHPSDNGADVIGKHLPALLGLRETKEGILGQHQISSVCSTSQWSVVSG